MADIKFVRKCERYGTTTYDIIYASGRSSLFNTEIPKTAQKFMEGKTPKKQWDKMNGWEYIYK